MSLIFVTGISGSGKSEVLKELRARGHKAYGTDEDGIAAFYDRTSGLIAGHPDRPEHRTPEWRAKHVWKAQRDNVEKLADSAKDKSVFLCGSVENDNEFWDLFSKVVSLVIDEKTLRHRIATRTNNNFGQNPHELTAILGWQKTAEQDYRRFGAEIIDATQPVDKVVDDILALV